MSATFDAGNRMQTITLNPGKPEQKIYNLTYDNNGNLTKKQLSTDTNCTTDCTDYVWDSRNRLVQIKQNSTTSATYSYDAENRRIQTNITTNGNTNQVSYLYAGSQSVGEVRNQQLSHSLMTGLQMDEHIARIALNQGATPQVKTYLTDALGSVIATAKADQSLEVGYAFSPYGQTQKAGVENQQQGSENSSQYTGRENDNNGLYFYRARYYDPILKRFISEDPIGLRGGDNVYAYVDGSPVSMIDPEGLAGCRVDFNDMPIDTGLGFSSTNLGGHAGVLGYSSDGKTSYYEYGRYGGDFGAVRKLPVPNLEMDKNGNPTAESLKRLQEYLSKKAGKGTPASLVCEKDINEKDIYSYAETIKNDPNRAPYSWNPLRPNHCRSFADKAMSAGGKK
jgi:RHS repeat-associated protein